MHTIATSVWLEHFACSKIDEVGVSLVYDFFDWAIGFRSLSTNAEIFSVGPLTELLLMCKILVCAMDLVSFEAIQPFFVYKFAIIKFCNKRRTFWVSTAMGWSRGW